jgi:hypothetical protein
VLVLALAVAVAGPAPVQEADRLAADAIRLAAEQPAQALEQARRALRLTADFDPTQFLAAGRKGEVVEDTYQAARATYRRHRALVYEAVGEALLKGGQPVAAERYLRRALDLDAGGQRVLRLGRALLAQGKGPEVLGLLHAQAGAAGFGPETIALVEQAVDAARGPSAQVELDRARLRSVAEGGVEFRDGPFRWPPGARLSTGRPARLDEETTVVYLAQGSCRTCSGDLEDLKRAAPPGTPIVLVPERPEEDRALRQVVDLYRYPWPILLGQGTAAAVGVKPGQVLVVGRQGWSGVAVDPPFAALKPVLALFGRRDMTETVPRKDRSGRPQ